MTDSLIPSGLKLFDTLRAEDEIAWLSRAFIAPAGFERMRGMRSIIVFGDEGSGKTAIRLRLATGAGSQTGFAAPLIVEWQPGIMGELEGEVFVAQFMDEILDLTAQELARHLAKHPERFRGATRWAQEAIVWLIHRYLKSDYELFLMRLEEDSGTASLDCLNEIFARTPRELLSLTSPYPRQMTEVVQTLKAAGFGGLWVMIDGLEGWLSIKSETLGRMLTALFSTLALFDIPSFAVKVMAPLALKNLVSASTGLARRRFDEFTLEWSAETLRALCERRLAFACSRERFGLESLSRDPSLLSWLEMYGGTAPRGWLEFLRVFLDAYLSQPLQKPLPPETVADLHKRFPPRLRMDENGEHVFLGYQPVKDISGSSLVLLRYLYRHPERSSRKDELYYRGLRGLDHQPRAYGDAGWEDPKTSEGVIDTAVWRLRQVLEPNPKEPIYVVSERGKGTIRLENAW